MIGMPMMPQPFFGRIEHDDPRDDLYLMRAIQPSEAEAPLVGLRIYERGPILNQGQTGTCVAHAWRAWLSGEPIRTSKGPQPFDLYDRCIKIDPWPENDNDTVRALGTSVRAGAQILSTLGHVKSYLWAFDVDDVRRWVLSGQGGVVLGTGWTSEMMQPDAEGIVRARGRSMGGHSTYLFGIDDRNGYALIQNSWGAEWGGWKHPFTGRRVYIGCCRLPLEDLDKLIRERGEACTATEQTVRPSTGTIATI